MGLENLRTIWADDIEGQLNDSPSKVPTIDVSPTEQAYTAGDMTARYNETFGEFNSAVDYMNIGATKSTYIIPDPFPEGFTINFNKPGYSFADGQVGDSKLLNSPTDYDIRTVDIDIGKLTGQKLGFGIFSSLFPFMFPA